MTNFLTYELLTPETSDPVQILITGQKERGFPDWQASNGVEIKSHWFPGYASIPQFGEPVARILCVRGKWGGESDDNKEVYIPLADWPLVKEAIEELNREKGEKEPAPEQWEVGDKLVGECRSDASKTVEFECLGASGSFVMFNNPKWGRIDLSERSRQIGCWSDSIPVVVTHRLHNWRRVPKEKQTNQEPPTYGPYWIVRNHDGQLLPGTMTDAGERYAQMRYAEQEDLPWPEAEGMGVRCLEVRLVEVNDG